MQRLAIPIRLLVAVWALLLGAVVPGTLVVGTASIWASVAHADGPAAMVFVSPFRPVNKEATALAALLPGFLEQELDDHPDLDIVPLDDVGPIHDTPADVYLASCPSTDEVGCAFVVAEVAGADFALAGSVEALESGTRVEVHVIDVTDAREVISFQADLGVGDDELFAEGVARVLVAVVRGEVGREDDIREVEGEGDPNAAQNALIARQLEQLSREIGDVTTMSRRGNQAIERPRMTQEDLAEDMTREGVKPWERIGMTPGEYIRFQNSGWHLWEWRKRIQGRKAQLLLRPMAGFSRGPSWGSYHGRFVRSATDLSVIDTYAWQATTSGNGFLWGGSVGYGVLPIVDVGLVGGMIGGRYEVLIQAETEGQTRTAPPPNGTSNNTWFVGPRVLVAPFQTLRVRPVLGVEATWWRGTAIDDHVLLQEYLPAFDPPSLLLITAVVGVEARMSDRLDLYAHVPVSAVLVETGNGTFSQGAGVIENRESPPALPTTATGIEVGVQIRLLGPKQKTGREFDDSMDPEDDY